jgi:hypothetical protein
MQGSCGGIGGLVGLERAGNPLVKNKQSRNTDATDTEEEQLYYKNRKSTISTRLSN